MHDLSEASEYFLHHWGVVNMQLTVVSIRENRYSKKKFV